MWTGKSTLEFIGLRQGNLPKYICMSFDVAGFLVICGKLVMQRDTSLLDWITFDASYFVDDVTIVIMSSLSAY